MNRVDALARPLLAPLMVLAASAIFAGFAMAAFGANLTLTLVAAVIFGAGMLLAPKPVIICLLVVRPALDAFQGSYLPGLLEGILNPAGLVTLGVIVAGSVWLLVHGKTLTLPMTPAYLSFLGVTVISVLLSESVFAGFGEWMRYLSCFLIYALIVSTVDSREWIKRFLVATILSAVVPVAVGLFQIVTNQVTVFYDIPQIRSVFAHFNGFGIFLAVVTPVAILLTIRESSKAKKLFYGCIALLMLYCLLRSYARVAWVGWLISVTVICVAARKRKWLVLLLSGTLVIWMVDPNVAARWALIYGATSQENSLLTRIALWQDAIALWRQNPVFGIGLRSFNLLSTSFSGRYTAFGGAQFHNTYIQILTETGVLGFASFLWVQIALVGEAVRGVKTVRGDPILEVAVWGFAGILAANLAMGVTDNIISSPVIQWYVWSFAGLASSAVALHSSNRITLLQSVVSQSVQGYKS